jgi:hypothetical protein
VLQGRSNVFSGSWSCKNGLAVALTPRDIGDVAVRGHFRRLVDFLSDPDFSRPGRFYNSGRMYVGGDYALIAAISGLMPMMFMTRVIL